MWVNMFSLLWILDYYLLLKLRHHWGVLYTFPYQTLLHPHHHPLRLQHFATPIGALRMLHICHPQTIRQLQFKNLSICGHIFFYGGGVSHPMENP
jgi:hypothetical protein